LSITPTAGPGQFNGLFALCREIVQEGQTNGFLRGDIQARCLTYVFLDTIDGIIPMFLQGAATG
jgi:hypothetical protein